MSLTSLPQSENPHLIPQDNLLGYSFADTLDASTPMELHVASYGLWLKQFVDLGQVATSKTIIVSRQARPEIEDLIWPVSEIPPGFTMATMYARKLADHRVVRRGCVHLMTNLSMEAAAFLTLCHAIAPAIYVCGGGWAGWALPASGPSWRVDLLDPYAVSSTLRGFLFENIPNPPRGSAREHQEILGFNRISEFRRLFELR